MAVITAERRLTKNEEIKVQACLDTLQRAQNLVNEAAQHLCPVRGFGDEWSAMNDPYDVIKVTWYKVRARLAEIRNEGLPADCSEPEI